MKKDCACLGCASALVLTLALTDIYVWLEGRVNGLDGYFQGLLFNMLSFPLWGILLGLLLWRIGKRGKCTRSCSVRLPWLIIAMMPWGIAIFIEGKNVCDVFTAGFIRWMDDSVDDEAIRDWLSETVTCDPKATTPFFFPGVDDSQFSSVPVPQDSRPQEISKLHPQEVRLLPKNSLILVWYGRFSQFGRIVFIGRCDSELPSVLQNSPIAWKLVQPGVYAGVLCDH